MARDFNGTSDIIKRGSLLTDITTNFTMSCWAMEITALSRHIFLNGNRDAGGGNGYSLNSASSGTKWRFDIAFVGGVSMVGTLTLGRWYHLTGTRDSTTWKLYVDGVQDGTPITNAPNTPSFNTTIGGASKDGGSDNAFFAGQIAECAIWSRVLDIREIQALARGYSPLFFKQNLLTHVPLIGVNNPERDMANRQTYAVTGTTQVRHPRIIYPRGSQ